MTKYSSLRRPGRVTARAAILLFSAIPAASEIQMSAAVRAKLLLYVDANNNVTVDGSSRVTQWLDLSGNGNHLIPTTTSWLSGTTNKPEYKPTGNNGSPSVYFTQGTGLMCTNRLTLSVTGGWSTYVIARLPDLTGSSRAFVHLGPHYTGSGSTYNDFSWGYDLNNGPGGFYDPYIWGSCNGAALYAANTESYTYYNLESHYAGQSATEANNHTAYVNGKYFGSAVCNHGSNRVVPVFMGNRPGYGSYSLPFTAENGRSSHIVSFLVFSSALTTAEQVTLRASIASEYGLPVVGVPTPSASITASATASVSTAATVSVSPSNAASPSVSSSVTASPSVSTSVSASPSVTRSATRSGSSTKSLTPTFTRTGTSTQTITGTATLSGTATRSVSATAPATPLSNTIPISMTLLGGDAATLRAGAGVELRQAIAALTGVDGAAAYFTSVTTNYSTLEATAITGIGNYSANSSALNVTNLQPGSSETVSLFDNTLNAPLRRVLHALIDDSRTAAWGRRRMQSPGCNPVVLPPNGSVTVPLTVAQLQIQIPPSYYTTTNSTADIAAATAALLARLLASFANATTVNQAFSSFVTTWSTCTGMPPSAGVITAVAPILPPTTPLGDDESSVALPVILGLGGAAFVGMAIFSVVSCVCCRPEVGSSDRDDKRDRDAISIGLTRTGNTHGQVVAAFASGRTVAASDTLRSRMPAEVDLSGRGVARM